MATNKQSIIYRKAYTKDIYTLPLTFDETSYDYSTWSSNSATIQSDIATGKIIQVAPANGSGEADFELPLAWLTIGQKVRIFNVNTGNITAHINITSGGVTVKTIDITHQTITSLMKTSMLYVISFQGF